MQKNSTLCVLLILLMFVCLTLMYLLATTTAIAGCPLDDEWCDITPGAPSATLVATETVTVTPTSTVTSTPTATQVVMQSTKTKVNLWLPVCIKAQYDKETK